MQISIDTTDLVEAADRLRLLDAQTLAELRSSTVDVVSLNVRTKSINDTHKQLNLTRDYIEARIERDEMRAGGNAARALIRSQVRGTTLQRFGATQEVRPVNWSNERIQAMGKKFGKWPGWTYRKGDSLRGIDEDDKAAGVSVDVNRKGAKTIKSGFFLPLRNGNGFGVFRRENGKLEHKYGPSVYQTFRRYIAENEELISRELIDTFLGGLDDRLQQI